MCILNLVNHSDEPRVNCHPTLWFHEALSIFTASSRSLVLFSIPTLLFCFTLTVLISAVFNKKAPETLCMLPDQELVETKPRAIKKKE